MVDAQSTITMNGGNVDILEGSKWGRCEQIEGSRTRNRGDCRHIEGDLDNWSEFWNGKSNEEAKRIKWGGYDEEEEETC